MAEMLRLINKSSGTWVVVSLRPPAAFQLLLAAVTWHEPTQCEQNPSGPSLRREGMMPYAEPATVQSVRCPQGGKGGSWRWELHEHVVLPTANVFTCHPVLI